MIALYLIAAHMAGDYLLQTSQMAALKLTNWRVRARHVTVYTGCCMLAAMAGGVWGWRLVAFAVSVYIAHFITDSHRWRTDNPWPPMPILHDQSLHAVQLAVFGGLFLT